MWKDASPAFSLVFGPINIQRQRQLHSNVRSAVSFRFHLMCSLLRKTSVECSSTERNTKRSIRLVASMAQASPFVGEGMTERKMFLTLAKEEGGGWKVDGGGGSESNKLGRKIRRRFYMRISTFLLFCTTHKDYLVFAFLIVFKCLCLGEFPSSPNSLCCTPIFSPLLPAFAKMQRCVLRVVLPKWTQKFTNNYCTISYCRQSKCTWLKLLCPPKKIKVWGKTVSSFFRSSCP